MALTDFTIIRRSMTARMFSTVTTIITVAVAVGLMLLLLSMRDSGRKAFERGSGNMHLLVSADSNALTAILNGIFYANPPQRPITWEKFQQISRQYPWSFAIPTQQGDSYRGFPVMATTAEFFTKFKPDPDYGWELERGGRFFDKPFEVVVGATAARTRGLRVGDRIFLTHGIERRGRSASPDQEHMQPHEHREYTFEIVGILKPTGSAHDRALFTDIDSSWIIHAHDRRVAANPQASLTTASDLVDEDRKITGMYLQLPTRPGSRIPAALQQVFDELRRDTSIVVAQPTQQIVNLFQIVSNIDQIFLGMAAVVMVSSAIAVMLALYNSMEQRRRQIAVLRVLGCSRPRVFGLIVTESAFIGLLGALAGVALAAAGGVVVASIMHQRLGLVIAPSLEMHLSLQVTLAAVALAAAAGIIPAAMAYRTSVANNLKPLA